MLEVSFLKNTANNTKGGGGAIYAFGMSWVKITNSSIVSNSAEYGGGVYIKVNLHSFYIGQKKAEKPCDLW